ncbi:hypothetical protein Hanom_Chr14g01253431 [Helianthus anomalus]
MFSKPYKFLIPCIVHALSHRKGAYDEPSDYIMNIITCLVLNRPYNISRVLFDHLVDNIRGEKYIRYPRFMQMMINDQVTDLPKDPADVMNFRNMKIDTLSRLGQYKGLKKDESEPRARRMICKINNPSYVAPENDAWRHDNSNSEDETERLGPSKKSPPRLVDEPVMNPADTPQEGVDLTKVTYDQFIKHTEDAAQVQAEKAAKKVETSAKHVELEYSEIDKTKIGHGKVTLKKKPRKKRKGSDEEDSTYMPTAEEKKKLLKRKAVPTGIIPRNVRAKKGGVSMPEVQSGKKEKHVITSKGPEAVKVPEVPEVQNVGKKVGDANDVVITKERVSTPPPPPPEIPDVAETSKPKKTVLTEYDMFHDATVKDLKKKVSFLEKEKAKAEADRDELKKQLEEITKVNEEIKVVVIKYAKKIKTLKEDVDDNAKLFEQLSLEITDLHLKNKSLNETNQTLHQMLSEIHEASASEIKLLKLEMEAPREDKAVQDEQLNMLYTVMEQHLGINVQAI